MLKGCEATPIRLPPPKGLGQARTKGRLTFVRGRCSCGVRSGATPALNGALLGHGAVPFNPFDLQRDVPDLERLVQFMDRVLKEVFLPSVDGQHQVRGQRRFGRAHRPDAQVVDFPNPGQPAQQGLDLGRVNPGAMLVTLIFTFGPISGAHFNPAVTLADASQGGLSWGEVPAYIAAQVLGAFLGVGAAHLMFGQALLQLSQHVRAGGEQLLSEFMATFGLLCVIWGCGRLCAEAVPVAVGLYITGAYWFTASTSFANPAVTLARAFTDTFAGIRPLDAPGFMVAQLLGACAATAPFRWLAPSLPSGANEVVFPHSHAGHEE